MGRRKRVSGLRKFLRAAYRALGVVNTASYILGAGSSPGKLAKHLLRKRASKFGSRIIR